MTLEIGTSSSTPIDYGRLVFDEQYTLRWIDRTEPKEEPKYEDPDKMQIRMKCEFEIVGQPDGLEDEDGPVNLIGQRVADFYTLSLNEKANFGQVVRSMLGMKPDAKFADPSFDVDSLCAAKNPAGYGGEFRATLRRKENGYPKIVMPLPVRGAKSRNAVTAGAAPAADPSEPPF